VWYYIDVHRFPASIQDRLSAFDGPDGASHAIAVALDEWYDPTLDKQQPFYDSATAPPTNGDLIVLSLESENILRSWVSLADRTVEAVPSLGVLMKALFVFLNAPLGSSPSSQNSMLVKVGRLKARLKSLKQREKKESLLNEPLVVHEPSSRKKRPSPGTPVQQEEALERHLPPACEKRPSPGTPVQQEEALERHLPPACEKRPSPGTPVQQEEALERHLPPACDGGDFREELLEKTAMIQKESLRRRAVERQLARVCEQLRGSPSPSSEAALKEAVQEAKARRASSDFKTTLANAAAEVQRRCRVAEAARAETLKLKLQREQEARTALRLRCSKLGEEKVNVVRQITVLHRKLKSAMLAEESAGQETCDLLYFPPLDLDCEAVARPSSHFLHYHPVARSRSPALCRHPQHLPAARCRTPSPLFLHCRPASRSRSPNPSFLHYRPVTRSRAPSPCLYRRVPLATRSAWRPHFRRVC
jgi:hypothetical protein